MPWLYNVFKHSVTSFNTLESCHDTQSKSMLQSECGWAVNLWLFPEDKQWSKLVFTPINQHLVWDDIAFKKYRYLMIDIYYYCYYLLMLNH